MGSGRDTFVPNSGQSWRLRASGRESEGGAAKMNQETRHPGSGEGGVWGAGVAALQEMRLGISKQGATSATAHRGVRHWCPGRPRQVQSLSF